MSEHHVDPSHTVIVEYLGSHAQWTGQEWNNHVDEMTRTGLPIIVHVLSTHPTPADAAVWLAGQGIEL